MSYVEQHLNEAIDILHKMDVRCLQHDSSPIDIFDRGRLVFDEP